MTTKEQNLFIHTGWLRRGISVLLMLCLLVSLMPVAFAAVTEEQLAAEGINKTSVPSPNMPASSPTKFYIYAPGGVTATNTSTNGTDTVHDYVQLVNKLYYPYDDGTGEKYYMRVYNPSDSAGHQWWVLAEDVYTHVMSNGALTDKIDDIWKNPPGLSYSASDARGNINVHAIQAALIKLGYLSGDPDGGFGNNTKNAVIAFQTEYGLTADGVAGSATIAKLFDYALNGAPASSPTMDGAGFSMVKSPSSVKAAMPKAYIKSGGTYYQLVSTQYYMQGTDPMVTVYNDLGSDSTTALEGLSIYKTALVDTAVAAHIKKEIWTEASPAPLALGNKHSLYVHAMQLALSEMGLYSGDLDGSFGSGTQSSLKNFQAQQGLPVNGSADTPTLQALYSGIVGGVSNGSSVMDSAGFSFVKSAADVKDALPRAYIKSGSDYYQLVSTQYYMNGSNPIIKIHPDYAGAPVETRQGLDYYKDVLIGSKVDDYIKGTVWTYTGTFGTLTNQKNNIDVQAMQLALKTVGLYKGDLDGSFGNASIAAVKNFQAQAGLTVDGAAGDATLKALFAAARSTLDGSSSASGGPDSIVSSDPKVYVTLSKDTNLFKTAAATVGVTAPKGSVLQLLANQYYTEAGERYYRLYHNNQLYNVKGSDISGCIMSDTALSALFTQIYGSSSFPSMNKALNLVGDVRVHALQAALKQLGYYSGALDGTFGNSTESAVRAFQSANKLEVDGRAGPITQQLLFALAKSGATGSTATTPDPSIATGSGTLKTTVSVNHRKTASKKAPRLAVVPRNTTLPYTNETSAGGSTWYYVNYRGVNGWLMGDFVTILTGNSGSSSGSSGTANLTQTGTVTITAQGTRVRTSPNGSKSGTVLAKGSIVPMLGSPSSAGGYTWYNIETSTGLTGWVRSDCAVVNYDATTAGTGTSGLVPSSTKVYAQLGASVNVFTSSEQSSTGAAVIPQGAIVQLVNSDTYSVNNVEYCSLYYNGKVFNAVYADVKPYVLTSAQLTTYLTSTIWSSAYSASLKMELNLVADIRVHAAQLALNVLGFYTGALDGNYGAATASAVRNFQRNNGLGVDGSIGPATWPRLFSLAKTAYANGGIISPTTGTNPITTSDFGTINSIQKASWDGDGVSLFPKNTSAKVMDTRTGKVYTIYRWSGGSHADCVPYSTSDTATMCSIVNMTYNSNPPSSSQLAAVKAGTGTWPDFKGAGVGSAWDRRPSLLNVNGKVYCVSIYGWPHGYNGTDAFARATFAGTNSYFFSQNNYYGMMCVHFVGSKTHTGGAVDQGHVDAMNEAYNYAKSKWPTLTK